MKRFTSLSAFFVALSLGVVALAAPTGQPVRVAQAQPAEPQSGDTAQPSTNADAGAPTDPAAATAPAAEPAQTAPAESSVPAVTLGTGAPGTDTPQAAAPAAGDKPAPRPWTGTAIFEQLSASTGTFFRGQQQDYNPTVESSLFLLPRYALSDAFQLRGRVLINYELTNSDSTSTRNEPRFSDTSIQLFYRKIPKIATIQPAIALSLGFPTSPESRARTMLVSPGIIAQFAKVFEHFLGGELMILGNIGYSHPFYESTTAEIRNSGSRPMACLGGSSCVDTLGNGGLNTADALSYTLMIAPNWGKWTPALFYLGRSEFLYSGKQADFNGQPVQPPAGFTPSTTRQSHYFSAWLDYEVNTWLTAEVGYFMGRTATNGNGSYANPFFDQYQDTRVYLGVNIAPDTLIQQITGKGKGDGGIVRARNNISRQRAF